MAAALTVRRLPALGWILGAALAGCASPHLAVRSASGHPPPSALAAIPKPAPPRTPSPTPTPAPSYPQARPVDQKQSVKVRSRSLRYDQQTQETVFYGGVTATQDTTVLNAAELRSQNQGQAAHASGGVVVRDGARHFWIKAGEADYLDSLRSAKLSQGVHLVSVDPYGRPVTVTGQDGSFSDLSKWARVEGKVAVVRGPMHASSLTATVSEDGGLLRLEGDVRATMDINRLQSQVAVFDQKEHSVDLEGDVRVRLIPDEIRDAADAPWSVSPGAKEGP